jgi:hypothetical protein
LIKAVAQAVPNYTMSCYKLPDGCCQEIEALLARFWWGSKDEKRKIHWMSWDRLSKAKQKGGMGFRGFKDFNRALLGKHCWRLMQEKNSLLERVFKSRYFPRSSFLEAKIGFQPSYAWRSILSAKEVVEKGSRWRIGNGLKVKIWKDQWLPRQFDFKIRSPIVNLDEHALVSNLIDPDTKQWDRGLIYSTFNHAEAKQILSIPISQRSPEDKLIWHWEKDGDYSVRSTYHLLKDQCNPNLAESSSSHLKQLWKEIWKAPVSNKIKTFLWRLSKNILPIRENLLKKGILLDPIYPICHNEVESMDHLFLFCDFAKVTWFSSPLGAHISPSMTTTQWLLIGLTCSEKMGAQLLCIILWKL